MSDRLQSFLSTLEQLPPEDIDVVGSGLADHLLAGMSNGGFESGLLSGDPAQVEGMKAALVASVRNGFIDRVGRTLEEDPAVNRAIARLVNPYALGVVNSTTALGFESNLVVASDPQPASYATAMNWRERGYKDVSPYLLEMPEGRGLRTPNEKLWMPGITRSVYNAASGTSERHYTPASTTSYANVVDSSTREFEETYIDQPLSFVNTVLVPLMTVKAFMPDLKPAPHVPSGRSGGAH